MDETLINRVRYAVGLGLSLDDLVAYFTDQGVPIELIFLAYHAALILENDDNV